MNIVFDCEKMSRPYTGLYEYCKQLGIALQKQLTKQDSLTYYVPSYRLIKEFSSNPYCFFKHQHFYDAFLKPRVKGADIWHTSHQISKYIGQGKPNLKRVLTIHDLNFLYEKTSLSKINKYKKIVQANIDRIDYIVAISEFTKQDILNNMNVGGKPVSVVYNGCNVLDFPQFMQPKYIPDKPFLFSIGTVIPKKNFHVLPALLVHNDFDLIIGGKGTNEYKKRIENEALRYGVEQRVKIIGSISDEEKYWYLKNSTAFLFPSIAEGFGIPAIEAMSFGKPVFLSNKTSLPEVGGEYAYYFDNFEPEYMQKVLEDGLNHYLTVNPQNLIINHSKKFNWDNAAEQYWQVYKSLIPNT